MDIVSKTAADLAHELGLPLQDIRDDLEILEYLGAVRQLPNGAWENVK
jgi:hypothetical protein